MSKHKLGSLRYQAKQIITKMVEAGIGQSRHEDKKTGLDRERIYSYPTARTYSYQVCNRYIDWVKEHHPDIRKLDDALKPSVVNEYIHHIKTRGGKDDKGHKPASQATAVAAIAKVAGVSKTEFAPTDPVRRRDIERSRYETKTDNRFSEERNKDLVAVCKTFGLRRCEVSKLRASWLQQGPEGPFLHLPPKVAKGGRERDIPARGTPEERARAINVIQNTIGDNKVFPKVHSRADIHSYRAEFATRYYNDLARPIEQIPPNERYICRGDRAGLVLDKVAMREVAEALGHSRINVIASNYLR